MKHVVALCGGVGGAKLAFGLAQVLPWLGTYALSGLVALLGAAWWRDALPVPDSRWVTLAEVPGYQPASGRAGLVVNVGSILGRVTFPFFALYGASKFAVEALSDGYQRGAAGKEFH